MAVGFHERKVNGGICCVTCFESSMINHPPLRNHRISVPSKFENHVSNIFTNQKIHGDSIYELQVSLSPSNSMTLVVIVITVCGLWYLWAKATERPGCSFQLQLLNFQEFKSP